VIPPGSRLAYSAILARPVDKQGDAAEHGQGDGHSGDDEYGHERAGDRRHAPEPIRMTAAMTARTGPGSVPPVCQVPEPCQVPFMATSRLSGAGLVGEAEGRVTVFYEPPHDMTQPPARLSHARRTAATIHSLLVLIPVVG
jgi:hypothetical protein